MGKRLDKWENLFHEICHFGGKISLHIKVWEILELMKPAFLSRANEEIIKNVIFFYLQQSIDL